MGRSRKSAAWRPSYSFQRARDDAAGKDGNPMRPLGAEVDSAEMTIVLFEIRG